MCVYACDRECVLVLSLVPSVVSFLQRTASCSSQSPETSSTYLHYIAQYSAGLRSNRRVNRNANFFFLIVFIFKYNTCKHHYVRWACLNIRSQETLTYHLFFSWKIVFRGKTSFTFQIQNRLVMESLRGHVAAQHGHKAHGRLTFHYTFTSAKHFSTCGSTCVFLVCLYVPNGKRVCGSVTRFYLISTTC